MRHQNFKKLWISALSLTMAAAQILQVSLVPAAAQDQASNSLPENMETGESLSDDFDSGPVEEDWSEQSENFFGEESKNWTADLDHFTWSASEAGYSEGILQVSLGFCFETGSPQIQTGDYAQLLLPQGMDPIDQSGTLYASEDHQDAAIGTWSVEDGTLEVDFLPAMQTLADGQDQAEFSIAFKVDPAFERISWSLQPETAPFTFENPDYRSDFSDMEEPQNPAAESARELVSSNLLQIQPVQIREVLMFELTFSQDWKPEKGDHFLFTVPEGLHLTPLGEIVFDAPNPGFRTENTGSLWRVIFDSEAGEYPDHISFQMTDADAQLLHLNCLTWNYRDGLTADTSFTIDLDFLQPQAADSQALGTFNPSLSEFGQAIQKADTLSYTYWSDITGYYGANAQKDLLKKIKEDILSKPINQLIPNYSSNTKTLLQTTDQEYICRVIKEYLKRHIEYSSTDKNNNKLKDGGQTAYSALMLGRTVCTGYAHAFSLLANALKIPTKIISAHLIGYHAFNITKLGNYYYMSDITWLDCGQPDSMYFLVGNDTIDSYVDDQYSNHKSCHMLDAREKDNWPGNTIYWNRKNNKAPESLATANFKSVDKVQATVDGKTYTSDFTLTIPAGTTKNISLGVTSGSKYCLTWTTSNADAVSINKSRGSGAVIKATALAANGGQIKIYSPRGRHITITVKVTGTKFIIRYKPGTGSGTQMADTTVTHGTSTKTSKCTYTKPGYTMSGWQLYHTNLKKYLYEKTSSDRKWFSSDGEAAKAGYPKKAVYSNGVSVATTTSIHNAVIEFQATWTGNKYQVKYLPDNSSASGSMANSNHQYGVVSSTSKCAFTLPGYTFRGWYAYIPSEKKWSYEDASGNIKHFANDAEAKKAGYVRRHLYPNGGNVRALTQKSGEAAEFHAQWQKNEVVKTSISSASVSGINANYIWTDSGITPRPTVVLNGKTLSAGADYTLTYQNNASVGTAAVIITGIGNYTGTLTKNFTISPCSISSASVSGIDAGYPWTGSVISPKPVVSYNGKTLREGTDYTLFYQNNCNAGNASVTISGKGNFNGSVSKNFQIAPCDLSAADITGYFWQYTWTGSGITPRPTVSLDGKTLTLGTDYTLSYRNNTEPGSASIIVQGTGNYTGSCTVSFTIVRASDNRDLSKAVITGIEESYPWTGPAIMPRPNVYMGSVLLVENQDYTLSYSNYTQPGTASVTVTGKGSYTGSKTIQYRITGTDINTAIVSGLNACYAWTGSPITPEVTLKIGSKVLQKGVDYGISYWDNIEPGTATIYVTGWGEYASILTLHFTILPEGSQVTERIEMHRLYNPNSGEHFYTGDIKEKDFLAKVGWKYEGIAWTAPKTSTTPVFRLFNPNGSDHHFTTSVKERDFLITVGWKDEGIGWYSADEQEVPLYRLYNPNARTGSHHYTTNARERDFLDANGWNYEGISWYGLQ